MRFLGHCHLRLLTDKVHLGASALQIPMQLLTKWFFDRIYLFNLWQLEPELGATKEKIENANKSLEPRCPSDQKTPLKSGNHAFGSNIPIKWAQL